MGKLVNDKDKVKVIFEDNHIIVVEKPVNVLSQADITGDPDILTILKYYLKEKYRKPGKAFLGLVHRLDRPVGGIMVFAKTSKAASRLSKQIRERTFKKSYLAVVHGKPDLDSGRLIDLLVKDEDAKIVRVTVEGVKGSKTAVLNYNVIETKDNLSLVKIDITTGRPHQIRVQFANIGHPLFGDQKYGADVNTPGQQIALWAHKIEFEHPTLKTVDEYSSSPPKAYPWDMYNLDI
ncbi:MAG: RNA pseudouridine synthase [Clostridia bacterium]